MILTTWTLADGTTGERDINQHLQEVLDRVWRKFGDTSKPLGGGSEFDRIEALLAKQDGRLHAAKTAGKANWDDGKAMAGRGMPRPIGAKRRGRNW